MIPLALRVGGFLSYQEAVTLDFTSFDLACISGGNGAGKSSLLDAMTWVLFGEARRKDEQVINTFSDAADVSFEFLYENNAYRLERSKRRNKPAQLEFQMNDGNGGWRALTEHSIHDTQERIEQTLHLDYDTFVNASFFLQGKADQFAVQNPTERKRILSAILGLQKWDAYRDEAARRRKALELEEAAQGGMLEDLENQIKEEAERKAHLAQVEEQLKKQKMVVDAARSRLDDIKARSQLLESRQSMLEKRREDLEAARKHLAEREQHRDALRAELNEAESTLARAGEIERSYAAWKEAHEQLERLNLLAKDSYDYRQRMNAQLTLIQQEEARLQAERDQLRREETQLQAQLGVLPELKARQAAVSAELGRLRAELEARPAKEAQLNALSEETGRLRHENETLKQRMTELKDRIGRLEVVEGATCPLCGQPLTPEHRTALLDSLNAGGKQLHDQFRANEAHANEAQRSIAELRQELETFPHTQQALTERQSQLDLLVHQINAVEAAQADWQRERAPRLAAVQASLAAGDFALEARGELARLDQDLKALGYDEQKHAELQQLLAEEQQIERDYQDLREARVRLDSLRRELQDAEAETSAEQAKLFKDSATYDQELAQYQTERNQLPDLAAAEREYFKQEEEQKRLLEAAGYARNQVEMLEDLKRRRQEIEDQRKELRQSTAHLKWLERAFGKDGIPALLIEQALPQIEEHANEILDRLSDGNMSVRFLTQQEYKDKKHEDKKETLDIQISDSAGTRPYEMYSGGEAFRVNFAIRLALSRVLAERAGARLQMLVIDEGFGSQDGDGRQRLVETIHTVQPQFAKILVITHLEELKDAFPTRIEVEKTPRGSRLQVFQL
jgi:exonuclease SbcC